MHINSIILTGIGSPFDISGNLKLSNNGSNFRRCLALKEINKNIA